jgi:hypothetical protein
MIAFKPFSLCPESEKPLGIPEQWPWQELPCEDNQIVQFELLGFTVVSIPQYTSYKSALQASFDAWQTTYANSVSFYKIYNFVENSKSFDTSTPPISLDFRTSLTKMLHRKSTLVKGECLIEEYYETCSVNAQGTLSYSNLVVSEHHAFIRDPLGFPVMRNSHIHYYDKNGLESPEIKKWTKFYNTLEKIQEGKTRRGNLVDNLQMPCIGLISIAMTGSPMPSAAVILEGRRFLFDYKKEFDAFVDESNREIVSCFNDSSSPRYASANKYSWINSMTPYGVTIRQFLISELTI